ncbi:MAG: DNA-directed RNA polymerase subunit alpha [Candidatus Muiribacteriota bacterium]
MDVFDLPESLKVKEITPYHGQFFLEPLRKGYGETMGNFMKDLLITELPGFSPVSITFFNIDKSNKKLEGTEEDILNIVMNIKNIICSLKKGEEYSKKIKFKGEKKVTAGDIEDENLTVLNKDLHLFTVKDKNTFEIEIGIKRGCGYVLSYEHKKENNVPFNKFYVDSFFSPIVFIDMDISPIRIGSYMNYEKLTLDIKTNGTVKAQEAVSSISKSIIDALSMMAEKREKTVKKEKIKDIDDGTEREEQVELAEVEREKPKDVNEVLISDLDLSHRTKNCLKNFPYRKLVDFTTVSADDLMRLKNFGQKSLNELREKLADYGLTLKGETLE